MKSRKNGMRIVVISDTHIPKAASDLPEALYEAARGADLVIHAGDFVEIEVLEKLKSIKDTVGVYGNMDSKNLRDALKPKEIVSAGKFRIGVIHGYGAPGGLLKAVRSEFGKVDAIVFGHSHTPTCVKEDGIVFLNPGSPTDKVFSPYNSYGVLTVAAEGVRGEIVRL